MIVLQIFNLVNFIYDVIRPEHVTDVLRLLLFNFYLLLINGFLVSFKMLATFVREQKQKTITVCVTYVHYLLLLFSCSTPPQRTLC